jgi:aspartyl-tRNA(Asn)/glutamyl-tRNA(Gln) amidotransferase subunit A
MSGKDVHDQTTYSSTHIPENIFESKIIKEQITVGYYTNFLENNYLDTTIKAAFQKMIVSLTNQGIQVIPLDFFDLDTLVSTYFVLAMAETSSNLARLDGSVYGASANNKNVREGYMITRSENLSDETKKRIIGGCQATSSQYDDDVFQKARILKNKILNSFNSDFEKVSLILSPVSATLPPEIGHLPENSFLSEAYTAAFNLVGLPTLTAPLFTPTGIQITADKNREDLILAFANYIEEVE